jgi:hypothetical protein
MTSKRGWFATNQNHHKENYQAVKTHTGQFKSRFSERIKRFNAFYGPCLVCFIGFYRGGQNWYDLV